MFFVWQVGSICTCAVSPVVKRMATGLGNENEKRGLGERTLNRSYSIKDLSYVCSHPVGCEVLTYLCSIDHSHSLTGSLIAVGIFLCSTFSTLPSALSIVMCQSTIFSPWYFLSLFALWTWKCASLSSAILPPTCVVHVFTFVQGLFSLIYESEVVLLLLCEFLFLICIGISTKEKALRSRKLVGANCFL